MKIPVDYFLYIIKNFMDELGYDDVSKLLKGYIEIPEKEFVKYLRLIMFIYLFSSLFFRKN